MPGLGLAGLVRRLAQSKIALGLALGLLVGGLVWFRPRLRSAATTAWERVEPALEEISEAMMLALEDRARTDEALQARLVLPVSAATVESAVARFLVERGEAVPSELIHAELLRRDCDISLTATRQMLRARPMFAGARGRGYQLGRTLSSRSPVVRPVAGLRELNAGLTEPPLGRVSGRPRPPATRGRLDRRSYLREVARAGADTAHNAAEQTGGVYRRATPEEVAQHEAAGADRAGETGVIRLRPYG